VSGLTMTSASFHANNVESSAKVGRVASSARLDLVLRFGKWTNSLWRKRFSAFNSAFELVPNKLEADAILN
jgi:hypothetical protein